MKFDPEPFKLRCGTIMERFDRHCANDEYWQPYFLVWREGGKIYGGKREGDFCEMREEERFVSFEKELKDAELFQVIKGGKIRYNGI